MGFVELQEKAKIMLSNSNAPPDGGRDSSSSNAAQLLQFIEEFCREGDRVVDDNKRDKLDLQRQVRWSSSGPLGCCLYKVFICCMNVLVILFIYIVEILLYFMRFNPHHNNNKMYHQRHLNNTSSTTKLM